MCTPTRAALDDGTLPVPLRPADDRHPRPGRLRPGHQRMAPAAGLKEAGYNTAIIGKWHLGHADLKYWPKQRGFDYQYGAMIGELDYYTHSDAGVLDWFRNNKPVHEKGYTTQLLGNDAVKYINEQSADKPFYLYLTFNAPHTPYQAPQDYIDRYKNIADPTRRIYAGMVTCHGRRNRPRGRRARQERAARQHADRFPERQRRHAQRDVRRPDGRPVQDQASLRQRPLSRRQGRALRRRLPRLRAAPTGPATSSPASRWTG